MKEYKIAYKLDGEEERILGTLTVRSGGKLTLDFLATGKQDFAKTLSDIGNLNTAYIEVDGKHMNYADFIKLARY